MSLIKTVDELEYPESDGKPMGETDLHRDWMIRILELLRWRYRQERVYLASDLLVYYEEGNPQHFVVPDDFVVTNCDPGRRRTFKIWEEDKGPEVVFEVTSQSTRREDEVFKPRVYARLGVREYYLYDPTADYLHPPLKGFRLTEGEYVPIEPDTRGAIRCVHLGLTLGLEGRDLLMFDSGTGRLLRTAAEAAEDARQAAEAACQTADAQREQAEAACQTADAQREQADAARQTADAQREQAEAARQAADAQREQAEAARQAAERRTSELEAEVERLRRELARRLPDR